LINIKNCITLIITSQLILIDATFVNSLGGINVFKQIVNSIKDSEKNKFIFFVDYRLKNNVEFLFGFKYFFTNGMIQRHKMYYKRSTVIKVVFSLGNVPMLTKKNTYQITYNMQYFVFSQKFLKNESKILWILKSSIIKTLFRISKSDVAVQTKSMAYKFSEKFKINKSKIFIYPIFSSVRRSRNIIVNNSFFYPSSGEPYKNIDFLIDSFKKHLVLFPDSKLFLTINEKYRKLLKKMEPIKNIINIGEVKHSVILEMINRNYIIVHPSKVESFGLVLLEASQSGNIIIAPREDYVTDVCNPQIYFSLKSRMDLTNQLNRCREENFKSSKVILKNRSRNLVKKLLLKLD
jgi:hypothetical protein